MRSANTEHLGGQFSRRQRRKIHIGRDALNRAGVPSESMTARWHEFGVMLDELEWTHADFCRMAGVGKNRVSRWKKRDSVPVWAVRFVKVFVVLQSLLIGGVSD